MEPVIAAELTVISEKPLIGQLRLHTQEGSQDFGVNAQAARAIIAALTDMLGGAKS